MHLTCATLLARRCMKTGVWPFVPKVNADLTNLLLQEEANRASSTGNCIDAATLQSLFDAWHDFAVPCETELKGGKSAVPHACKCTRDGHERWCVVGVDGFSTWLSTTNKPLSKAIQATKGATHIIALLKQAVPGLETAHCEKATRAPAGTMYAQERPRNAIIHWRAKSEGKLNPKKPSTTPVATKHKTTTFGAEQGNAKKQKSIVVLGVSGAGGHGIPQTHEEIERGRAARKEREKGKQKSTHKKKQQSKKELNINTSKSDSSDEVEESECSDVPSTSKEEDSTSDETSDEVEDEKEEDEDSQNVLL